ncbi:hypothetical protein ACYO9G_00035 [Staphylococcus aureus]
MSQQLLDHNISFLEETQMNIFNEESLNENIFHFVANSLSDINYKLNAADILFTFSLDIDIRRVWRSTIEGNIPKEEDEMIKDPTRQIDSLRLGILTEKNTFFEFIIHLSDFSKGHIHLLGISKLSIESIQPVYTFYDQSIEPSKRTYKKLDHLHLSFDKINEDIELYGHSYISNKSLNEISRELFLRL